MFVDQISKRDAAAVPEAFPRVFLQAALCVARKIRGVVLCKSFEQRFENDSFRRIWNRLIGVIQGNAVLFEACFIYGCIILIPAETVEIPHNQRFKPMMIAILYHALKLRAIVGVQAGQAAIRVYFNDRHAVFFGKAFASADLPFNGFLALIVARKTGVYSRLHAITYS